MRSCRAFLQAVKILTKAVELIDIMVDFSYKIDDNMLYDITLRMPGVALCRHHPRQKLSFAGANKIIDSQDSEG